MPAPGESNNSSSAKTTLLIEGVSSASILIIGALLACYFFRGLRRKQISKRQLPTDGSDNDDDEPTENFGSWDVPARTLPRDSDRPSLSTALLAADSGSKILLGSNSSAIDLSLRASSEAGKLSLQVETGGATASTLGGSESNQEADKMVLSIDQSVRPRGPSAESADASKISLNALGRPP
jgi:hypothetical protein